MAFFRRAAMAGVLMAAACGKNDGPPAVSVQSVTVSAASTTLLVGATTLATAQVTGTDGNPVTNAQVSWTSLTPAVVSVSPGGVITALAAGQGTVRATAGGKSGEVSITVKNPPVATITFPSDSIILTLPNGTTTVAPVAKDAGGKVIANPTFFFSSDAPKVATVTQLGVVTAVAAGTAVISASADNATGSMKVRVTANATATSPKITSVTPLAVGGSAVVSGSNFSSSITGNAVLIEGVPVTVTAASTTQLNITLPASGWACSDVRPVTLQVNANNETGIATATLRTAIQRQLAVGQSLVLSAASDSRCNELSATGGAYLVTVYNVARAMAGGEATFALRGAANTARAQADAMAIAAPAAVRAALAPVHLSRYARIGSARFAQWQEAAEDRQRQAAHASVLRRSLDFLRTSGSATAAWRRVRALGEDVAQSTRSPVNQVATLGAISPIKIPNLDGTSLCGSPINIGGRTAWVGQHAVILEDTASALNGAPTLKGQLDSLYASIGQEFDTVMWPILITDFGNPLAMDQQLSRTGKIVMVFSARVNNMAGGLVAAFTASCDFFPASQAPSSNVGEYFYGIMPTSLATGYATGTRDSWLREMRATLIHETKHITSFGERLARSASYEELWLEEGLARHAEEQYARGIYGVAWKANSNYQSSTFCDWRPASASAPQCAGRPLLMLRHFDELYQYLQAPESRTPLGPMSASDATFYGTAWSVVRWMMDQYAPSEAAFLSALVQSNRSGIANLEARVSGHAWEEMLGEWALSLFADDYPGVAFTNPRLSLPSWNLRDQFAGLCSDRGPCTNPNNPSSLYPLAYPFVPRPTNFGTFSTTVTSLMAGSFTSWYLSGTQLATQLLDLRGANGGDPPGQLRVAILRVQ